MRLTLLAVGKLKAGPERSLVDEYVKRAAPLARQLGFKAFDEIEVASGGGLVTEAERVIAKLPPGAMILRLDEHGDSLTSKVFADRLGRWRDAGTPQLVLIIGGAEGYAPALIEAAPHTLALGPQTWPHRLVRVMLAEQVYRALSILAGTPYHKDGS